MTEYGPVVPLRAMKKLLELDRQELPEEYYILRDAEQQRLEGAWWTQNLLADYKRANS